MDNILDELYHGEYEAMGKYDKNAAHQKALRRVLALEDELQKKLPENLLSLFEKLTSAAVEALDACGAQDFKAGYQLGVRMMVAALPGEYVGKETDDADDEEE